MCVIILDNRLLNTDIFPFIVSFLRFHCFKTFFIFGNFNLQLLSVILFNSFLLNSISSSTNPSVNISFSFS